MKNTILVTGCCGFIGSHMCNFLINKGHNVIGLDNFLTGSLENIEEIYSSKKFTFIEHDVCHPIKLK